MRNSFAKFFDNINLAWNITGRRRRRRTDTLTTDGQCCRCCRNLVNHYTSAGDLDHARLFTSFVEEFESTYARHATG